MNVLVEVFKIFQFILNAAHFNFVSLIDHDKML